MPLIDPVTMSSKMSSPSSPNKAAAAASTTSPSSPAAPNLYPIALLDTPASSAIAHARPAIYLGLLALRFGALVRDPVSELRASLPVVAAGQLAYAICCLPVAGSQDARPSRKSRPGERKKNDASGPRPVVVSLAVSP